MGLDNGITVKVRLAESAKCIPGRWKLAYNDDYEICYERKCWGLRNDITGYLNRKYKTENISYEWDLSVEDIQEIKNIYIEWLDEEKWENDGDSIWSFDEHCHSMAYAISDLNKLMDLMNEHPDIIPSYYDSY